MVSLSSLQAILLQHSTLQGSFLQILKSSTVVLFYFYFFSQFYLLSVPLSGKQPTELLAFLAFHSLHVLLEQYHIPVCANPAKLNINSWKCSSFLSPIYLLDKALPKLCNLPVSQCLCCWHVPGATQQLCRGRLLPPDVWAVYMCVRSQRYLSCLGCCVALQINI